MKKIYLSGPFTIKDQEEIKKISNHAEYIFKKSKDITVEDVKSANAIVGNVKPEILKENKQLEWIQLTSAGVNQYMGKDVIGKETVLTCMTGAYGLGISEYLITYMLMIMKNIPQYMSNQQQSLWQDEGQVTSPIGKRILVLGTGNLGQEFAKRAQALGSILIGMNKSGRKVDYFNEIYPITQLKEQLTLADVIVITLPGTNETYHMFNEEIISSCKDNAILMNVGRGNIIDNDALIKHHSLFKGIYLDVIEGEPIDQNHPLWTLSNVYITPHITGGYHLDLTVQQIVDQIKYNLNVYLNGGEYKSIVDLNTGYAKRS